MIHFVGAGPGDPDLLTVRGAELLKAADAVIYAGSLVNPALLSLCRTGASVYNSAEMTLEQVLRVMREAHGEGKEVVRLHSGDPSLYGAVREQMDALKKWEIPLDVTPGVSSFCAAAAALETEYTLPGVSQSVILTRMRGRTPTPERENVSSLAAHGASMAVFLSAGLLPELQRALLQGAYNEETPAALVYRVSWPQQKLLRCTVGTLPETGRRARISSSALVLVGDFLGENYERSRLYDPAFSTGFRAGAP